MKTEGYNTSAYTSSILEQPGLLIIGPSGGMQEIALSQFGRTRLFIGRDPSKADIPVSSPVVSGVHAKLKIENGYLYFADVNSTNGTWMMNHGTFASLVKNRYVGPLKEGTMFVLGAGGVRQEKNKDAVLVIITNAQKGKTYKEFPVFDQDYVIGRAKDCDIVLKHPSVSKHHARFGCTVGTQAGSKQENKIYYIEDLGSSNGVFVNGQLVQGNQAVREKDVIQIAGNVLIFSSGRLICKTETDGIQLTTRDLVKKVNHGKKMILSHVNCNVERNEFVAIVGGSGAGKSTLLKTLGGYDRDFEGDVYYNGISLKRNYNILKNIIGYVPQEDIVYENLTLKKMLYYTAKMKMPDGTSKKEIYDRIREVLQLIELTEHQNTMIRDLSGGQKKRASIAVELLADPGMFFLDEPTSGLDPGTEQKLMRVLNRLSKTQGKTIIMVTHTTQSLDLCDKIIFMGKDGTLAFMGTPKEAKMFFGTDSLVEIYNLLEEDTKAWAQQFARFNELGRLPESGSDQIKKPKRKSFFRQLAVLTKRYGELIMNDLPRLFLLLIQPVLIAILIKLVADKDVFNVFEPTKQILFTFSCSGIWIGIFNTIQEVCKERAILKREYMSNLRLSAYVLSKYLMQLVVSLVQTLIFVGLFILLMGNVPEDGVILPAYVEIFITMWLTIYASSALGLFVSSIMKNGDRAMAFSPFLLIIQLLFSGILFTLDGASEVISYITVSRWSVEGLGNVINMNNLKHKYAQVKYSPDELFTHGWGHLSQTWLILLAFIIVLGICSVISLRNVSRDR
ncbi:MAG: FHA domain-containing protein [Clostridiales bacterium]|nr:FHA domain-containing protein [Clostridiales bacterium]